MAPSARKHGRYARHGDIITSESAVRRPVLRSVGLAACPRPLRVIICRVQLLGLIRFLATDTEAIAWQACERFEAQLPGCAAELVHREDLQMLVFFHDAGAAMAALAELLEAGELHGFASAAALVQGIRSRGDLAASLSGFTLSTIAALFELGAFAGPQEVAISTKLSSLIGLAAPGYIRRFEPAYNARHDARMREPLVMRPSWRRTPSQAPMPLLDARTPSAHTTRSVQDPDSGAS